MPKVSVIIPVYNVELYLWECLDRVVNQTLQDIEIICVNDGSTDGSLAILEKYSEHDKRIILLSQENKGQSAARNAGLEIAAGDYVYFMDSDDLIEQNCLGILYETSIHNKTDILYFNADVFFESDELKDKHASYCSYYNRKKAYQEVSSGLELLALMDRNGDFRPSPCLQFLRMDFIKSNKLFFYEGIIHEDNLFSFKCIVQADKVMHINDVLFHRRIRDNSTMTKVKTANNVIGYFTCFIEMMKFCLLKEINSDVCRRQIKTIFHNAKNDYLNLSEVERKKIKWDKDSFENFMFELLVKNQQLNIHKKKDFLEFTPERSLALQNQLNMVYQSKSYKWGQILTYLPRKIYGGIRCYREHGLYYTLCRAKEKIVNKIPNKKFNEIPLDSEQIKKKDEIAVSIIMPVYNVENYLEQCLDSLLEQTFKSFEIICVDDGSTDKSVQILEQYKQRDSRIKIISRHNQYPGFARNTGLKFAKGEYVFFVDSDDFVEPNLLERTYYKAKVTDADIVVFGANIYNQNLNQFIEAPWFLQCYKMSKKDIFSWEDIRNKIFNFTAPNVWTKLFKKNFLKENNLYFAPFESAEDLPFTYYALALANKIVIEDDIFIHYRKGITTNISSNKDNKALIFYDSYSLLQSELIEAGIYEKVKQSFINRCLSSCIYEIESLQTEKAKNIVKRYFVDEIVFKLELYDKPKEFIYNQSDYIKMKSILSETESWCTEDKNIKVSVIIPVFNSEEYLENCLISLINQTLIDVEFICIDDGSTDDSLNILRRFENCDSRIHVLEQNNSYAGVARNYGMRMSKGEYLIFLDSDDFFEHNLLEKLYLNCKENMVDVSICAANSFHDKEKTYKQMPWQLNLKNLKEKQIFTPDEIEENIFLFCTGVPWNKMFRRSYLKNLNICFQNTRCANDLYFIMIALVSARKIGIVNEVLVHYRVGVSTNLQSTNDKNPFDFCRALLGIRAELIRTQNYERYKQSFINLALNNSMYNLKKVENNKKVYEHLYIKLRDFYFPLFEIDEHEKGFYLNQTYWEEYVKIFKTQDIVK